MAARALSFDEVRAAGLPVYSLNRQEKMEELRLLLRFDHRRLIRGGVVGQTMHAMGLAWNYYPLAWAIKCGNRLSPEEVYWHDDLLRDALERRKMLGKCETQSDLRKALRTYSGTQACSNFRPSASAAIYDRYLPEGGGTVWDMSAGFGGRLLGALACGKVTKYVGTDPNSLTFDGLMAMKTELPSMMHYMGYDPPEIELRQEGSEVPKQWIEKGAVQLCCTSPPYFNCEKYSDEQSQSYIKFPTKGEWLHGFMKQTLDNCNDALRDDGYLVINLAGVKSYPALADDFVVMAESNGWRLVETLKLLLSTMPGTRKKGDAETHKSEPIFVFRKVIR